MVQQHERLKIWQKSYDLAKDLMQVTERFPRPQQMEAGTFDGDARSSIASWIGYTKHADCHGLNCQIAERHPFLRVAFDPVEVTE
jgi:hypothetical protein